MAVLTARQLENMRAARSPGNSSVPPPAGGPVNTFSPEPKSRIREVKAPTDSVTWVFEHPDNGPGDPIQTKYIVDIPGTPRETMLPEQGRYSTKRKDVADYLKTQGFRCVNDAPTQDIDPVWEAALKRHKENLC